MIKRIALIAALLLYASGASAQYPNKPVRIVIPFGPGSSTDAIMRILATPLSAALGQQVIIDPKPGGDGAISAIEVARAAPDGYTLGVGSGSPLAAVPALRKNPPYNPVADFTPITDIGRYTVFLYVNASVPANTFQEFVAHVKANPGKLAYGTGNASGIVAFAQMNTMLGLDMLHVPYKSAPPAVLDLVGNRVQVMMDPPTAALAFVKEGKLRAVAVTSLKRSAGVPDVPTVAESGFPGFDASSWFGLTGPAGLPRETANKISADVARVLKAPEMRERFVSQGADPVGSTPEAFGEHMRAETAKWARLVKASGAKAD